MPRKRGSPDDSGPTSLFILAADNPIRMHAKHIIELPVFEYAVLVTITANCVVLAMEEHLPGGDRAPLAVQLVSCYFTHLFSKKYFPLHVAQSLILQDFIKLLRTIYIFF